MKLRLRTRNRLSHRTRIRLRYAAVAGTMFTLAAGIFFLYNFIGQVSESRAAERAALENPPIEVLEGYAGRKKINILAEQLPVSEQLRNFPVLISLRLDELKRVQEGGMVSGRDGEDIVFTAADGKTILPYQIERYEPISGKLTAWVNFAELNQANRSAYLYFGKTDAHSYESDSTFQLPYTGVWHFNRNFQNSSTIPVAGEYRSVKDEEGRFAAGKEFLAYDGSHIVFETQEILNFSKDVSVSAWVKCQGGAYDQTIATNSNREGGFSLWLDRNSKPVFEISQSNKTATLMDVESRSKLEVGKWYNLTGTYSSETDSLCLYVDGVLNASIKAGINYQAGTSLTIGAMTGGSKAFFNGTIDELRISQVAYSAARIRTSWLNESDPESFFTVDDQEVFSASPRLSEIQHLEASSHEGHVTVRWQTTRESNLDYYSLERSSDGKEFRPVARVLGKGSMEDASGYFLIDPAPVFGVTYYRVRSYSFKGESQATDIMTIHTTAPATALGITHVEPNPFKERFRVSYNAEAEGDVEIKLTSISGQLVYSDLVKSGKDTSNQFEFNAPESLRPGIYFLSLHQENEQKTVKLIKQL